MVHYQDSYLFGTKKEKEVLPILQAHFNSNIQMNPENSKYDFQDERFNYELKSRTCKSTTFNTTMISSDKCNSTEKEIRLVFNFVDGLYYIEYNKRLFDTYKKELFSRADRGDDEKLHYFIPVDHLTIIKKYESI
jgi:hypothetical protein